MNARAIIMALIGISSSFYALGRPYVGLLLLGFLYFFRPDMWGAEDQIRYILWINVAVGLGWLFNRKPGEFISGTGWLLVILILYSMATLAAPFADAMSYQQLADIVKIFITAFLIVRLCDTPRKLAGFVVAILLGCVWFSKVVLIGWRSAGYSGDVRIDTAVGQGGGANYIAWVLATMLPFVLYKVVRGTGWQKAAAIAMCILYLGSIVATGSRGGFLCVIAGCGVLLMLMRQGKLLVVAAAGVVAFALLTPSAYWDRINTITTDPTQMDASSLGRYQNMQAGFKLIDEFPIFGTGLQTFARVKHRYGDMFAVPGSVAHNTYIQMACEVGLPVLLMYLTMCVHTVARLLGRRRAAIDDASADTMEWMRVGTISALAATAVQAVKGDMAHMDFFWWVYAIALASARLYAEGIDEVRRAATQRAVQTRKAQEPKPSGPGRRKPRWAEVHT